MYKDYIIKSISEQRESVGEEYIDIVQIEAEVKRSFFEKLTKKAEVHVFNALINSETHRKAQIALSNGSTWSVNTDNFQLRNVKGGNIYIDYGVINEKNRQIDRIHREKEAQRERERIDRIRREEEAQRRRDIERRQRESELAMQTESEEQTDMSFESMNLHRYFNAERDLQIFNFRNSDFSLRPYDPTYLQHDISSLNVMLSHDPETKKSFPDLWGPNAGEAIQAYLINTCMTTDMGIAFAYALRLNNGIVGLIKVTSPDHNKVTNNFPHWLIDYIMIPAMRNQGLMKASLRVILKFMHEKLRIDEVYAMVDPDNSASIHLLEINGFEEDESQDITENPGTGNKPIAMRKTF